MPKRTYLEEYEGLSRVESYTVYVKAEGPTKASESGRAAKTEVFSVRCLRAKKPVVATPSVCDGIIRFD